MEKSFTKSQMQKRITAATFTGIVIGLLGSYLYFRSTVSEFTELTDKSTTGNVEMRKGRKAIEDYRKTGSLVSLSLLHGRHKLGGIVHEFDSFKKIYDNLDKFRNNNTLDPTKGYEWGIGVYPSIVRSLKADLKPGPEPSDKDSVARLCIYFIPTMFNRNGTNKKIDDILDYNDYKDDPRYPSFTLSADINIAGGGYIYDQGTIFP
ncbi:MAG TPA: hypothetical protein PLJ60_02095 [Chryseolinea sp.]|nr:hypothetical protein [Chryseolinea sp.]HPM29101.1 hypothetical protein [Chryseolinea sp.]